VLTGVTTLSVRQIPKAVLGAAAVLFWMHTYAAADRDFHLTGIIGSNTAKVFAVIEQPDGQQHLLVEGGKIGNGYVGSISVKNKTAVLVFPDGELLLSLTGSANPEEYEEPYTVSDYSVDTAPNILGKTSLEKLQALARASGKLNDDELAIRLNRLLGLPDDARITAFNESGVNSTRDLVKALAVELPAKAEQGSYLGTISVAHDTSLKRVYLQTPPQSTTQ